MTVQTNPGLATEALNDVSDTLSLLGSRRSASAKAMAAPGPTPQQIERLLQIAVRVPDHGKLTPWRFILFEDDARAAIGEVIAARWQELNPSHGAETVEQQRSAFTRAPVVLAVVSTAGEHVKIPVWEQVLSAGAVCQNILVAATAMQVGCQWITGWYAYDRTVLAAMGLCEAEKIAGLIYLGTPAEEVGDRPRPEPASLLTRWTG